MFFFSKEKNGSQISSFNALIKSRRIIFLSVVFIISIILVSWFALSKLETQTRKNTIKTLKIVLNTTQEAYSNWTNLQKLKINNLVHNTGFINNTLKLLNSERNFTVLSSSSAQTAIRAYFRSVFPQPGKQHFFIISPDYINIACFDDKSLGKKNLIVKSRKYLLDKVLRGFSLLIPPVISDTRLPEAGGELIYEYPTMFIIAPVRDKNKMVIAALAVSINPFNHFTRIALLGRIGQSGETYAVDREGRLITESRFYNQLQKTGLIPPHSQEMLQIQIKDPGGNLLSGYKPRVPRKQQPLTFMARQVTAGKSGYSEQVYRDYRGVPVLGAWVWDEDLGFGITTEIDEEEALQPYFYARNLIFLVILTTIILSYVLIFFIVTIRRKAERELHKQSETIRALVETSQDWIWEINLQGMHTYTNPGVEHILGYKPDEMIGRSSFDFMHKEDIEKSKMMLPGCVIEKKGWRDEVFRWRHKEGKWRFLESNAVPIFSTSGEITGFRGIDRDITERKQAEVKLQESEKRYKTLYESANDAIFIMKDNIFVECNPKTEQIFACSQDKIVGQTPFRFSPEKQPDGEDSEKKGMKKIIDALSGKPQFFEWQHIRYNGKPFDAEVSLTLIELSTGKHLLAIVRDVTSRKSAENALSKSEARYRRIIEDQEEFIVRWRPDGTRTFVNESYCRYYGTTPGEAIGSNFFPLISEEDRKNVQKRIAALTIEHPVSTGEHRVICPDGSMGWNRWTDRALFDDNGQVTEYQSVGMDITERKLAEETLRESEERLKMAAAVTKLATYDWYPVENRINWDERMHELFELNTNSRKDRNKYFLEVLHPDDKKRVSAKLESLFFPGNKEDKYQDEYRIILKNETKYIVTQGVCFRNGKDIVTRIIGTCLDITDIKQAEETILESEERFRILSESAFEGIVITEKGRVRDANKKISEMMGIKLKDMIGMPVMDFVAPESRKIVEENIAKNSEELYEHLARRKDGSVFPVEVQGKSIPFEGKMIRVTAIRDITERTKLQEQLMQAQKMESIGQLAAGMAHDYNNILTAINGFAQLASMKTKKDSFIWNYLNEILEAGQRATRLTSQLLTFSRKQVIEPKILDINAVINRLDKMLYTLVGEGLTIKLNLAKKISPVKADVTQIEQILVNLVINARDAVNDKTGSLGEQQIIVETKDIYLDEAFVKTHTESSVGYHVLISVSDTGTGVSREKLSKIFEPFFTTKKEGKGTGLGLATVYGIVKQNNGSIYVYSETGQGTTFNIYWPAVNKDKKQFEGVEQSEIFGGNESILVVEDDNSVIEFVRSFLTSLGYTVFTENDGKNALEFAKQNPGSFQLLLTDVILPKMNGKELSDELNKFIPGLKVIYASGYSGEHISKSGILDEGLNFINKPYSMHSLAKKIREVLDK